MDARLAKLMSQNARDAVMAPIDSALSLPANAYTSHEWLALEVERIFQRRWTGVCFDCVLSQPGDVRPFDLFGMPLVAICGDDKTLRVFHNICPYDGCLAVRKDAQGLKEIEVYYHGWRYDLRGKLLQAPYWNGYSECGPEALGERDVHLVEVRSATGAGVLFVNLDGQAQPIDDWLAPWRAYVGNDYAIDALVPARDAEGRPLIETRVVNANWKTYQENASINILHEAFTHELYRRSPEVPRVDLCGSPTFKVWTQECLVGFAHSRKHSGNTYAPMLLPSAGHDPSEPPAHGFFTTQYPNINIPLLDSMIKVNIAIPVSPDQTFLQHLRFYRPQALELDDFQSQETALQQLFDVVHREDQLAIEAVQKARSSPVYTQHYYAPFWDTLHHRFNQLVMHDMEKT